MTSTHRSDESVAKIAAPHSTSAKGGMRTYPLCDILSPSGDVTPPSDESIHIVPFLQETIGQLRIISTHHVVRSERNHELLSSIKGTSRSPSMGILSLVEISFNVDFDRARIVRIRDTFGGNSG